MYMYVHVHVCVYECNTKESLAMNLDIGKTNWHSTVIANIDSALSYHRAGNFREVIFSLYSRIVRIRETLTAKILTDAH